MEKEERIKALKKALGEPVGFEISDVALKVKRNVMLVSLVVIVLILGEIKAADKISIFGVSLVGVTPAKLMLGLSVVLIYSLAHYLWYCTDFWGEWSLRVTGVRVAKGLVHLGDDSVEELADPKQSTLYTWWLSRAENISAYSDLAEMIDTAIDEAVSHLGKGGDPAGIEFIASKFSDVRMVLRRDLVTFKGAVESNVIPMSLERFDRRFIFLLRSQNLRVLLADIILPIVLALYAGLLLLAYFDIYPFC
ncbi:hypothetical protein [Aquipseudomonas alcaligenes]|uniref:hypothetical protein n=1 Tax=Aquipseudomonas alcaligenes TaxID=43263 RepID=UPI003749D702